jgi:hypothetical protein
MKDELFGRLWVDQHERFSGDLTRRIGRAGAAARREGRDPLPLVARAMALVLATSLSTLMIGATAY